MQSTTVWTSALVQQCLEKLRMGMPTDLSAFHAGNIELKAADLLYQLTPEEIDEFHKCSENIIYFVEKYCRFMTDKGRRTVPLRNYQKKILKLLAEEKYIEALNELGPKNRNLIIMASRQTGKCFFGAEITIKINEHEINIPINLLYYFRKQHLTFLEKIKIKLMILYYKVEKM
jgi:hypothetical protein